MPLQTQIQIYAADTGDFYSKHESYLHKLNHRIRIERNQLIKGGTYKNFHNKGKRIYVGLKNIENQLYDYGLSKQDLKSAYMQVNSINQVWMAFNDNNKDNAKEILELIGQYIKLKKIIELKTKKIKDIKNQLLKLLNNKADYNIKTKGKDHIRQLNDKNVKIVSFFESAFTRTINAKPNELNYDFMVIQIYYFDVLRDILFNGYEYKGEKYIYFTSSAGQIRTKKCVFIKESIWKQYEKTFMCGLTIDNINKQGGCNTNKFLAYTALLNSATDKWEEFDIDKTIVIDDFETNVYDEFDFIDDKDFSITRKRDCISITHTDGAGMILPDAFGLKQCNKMVRLPFIKGLLGVFQFDKFIKINNCSSVIRDIYGVEHDIIKENIQVIFTKSQFKFYSYYQSWEQYKKFFKQYHCSANFTNPEEERIKDATINYQMLQSLTDITDEEINQIAKPSIDKLINLCSSVDDIKNVFGITPYNLYKTAFQKAIEIYPELLNDAYIRIKLKDIKDSLVKKYKSGKLQVKGKYTFILPDFYAACEHWFMGFDQPQGLLNNGEVFCWLFRLNNKLDCLRSPHLFMEHCIRNNIAYNEHERQEKVREWFCTNAIYTSSSDMISKVLQFDVDGDKALVVSDKVIIDVAERNIKKFNIVPLYYEMKKAKPSLINNDNIYNGLIRAFTGGNIGIFSNNISKIWNDDVFISGTDKEKLQALDNIKCLVSQNNYVIDYAKTLYKPEFPQQIKQQITSFTNNLLPYFFKYAKDKTDEQTVSINNSFVNKLNFLIPNPRISCKYTKNHNSKKLSKPDYKLLMSNPDIEIQICKSDNGRLIEGTNPVILNYIEKAKLYFGKVDTMDLQTIPRDALLQTETRQKAKYQTTINNITNELSQFGYSDKEVADILVKYLYGIKDSKYKDLLWTCYGNILYENLLKHKKQTTKAVQCIDCGDWFEIKTKDNQTRRCIKCNEVHNRILKKGQNKRAYLKRKELSSSQDK